MVHQKSIDKRRAIVRADGTHCEHLIASQHNRQQVDSHADLPFRILLNSV